MVCPMQITAVTYQRVTYKFYLERNVISNLSQESQRKNWEKLSLLDFLSSATSYDSLPSVDYVFLINKATRLNKKVTPTVG